MSKKTLIATNAKKQELNWLKRMARHNHGRWIEANPSANLSDLLDYLRTVEEELHGYDSDDVLADIIDELDQAAVYLDDFPELDEPVFEGDEELQTVEYRLANVEEDIADAERLIEELGVSYRVSRLPKQKR
jgi:hypothetical protein